MSTARDAMAVSDSNNGPPTAIQHPVPSAGDLRRSSQAASIASSHVSLANRLEQSAEEMSAGGSDIAEEIRKMHEEQKELERRESFRRNSVKGEPMLRMGSTHSRASSHNTSILDVNSAARWGGYSPEGFVTSPVGSVRSTRNSWGQPVMRRKASVGEKSRLSQMVEPLQEGRPLDSPLGPAAATFNSQPPTRRASQSSFAMRYDQIANQIDDAFASRPPTSKEEVTQHDFIQLRNDEVDHSERYIERPRSTDTFREAQFAFKDFDGVHFSAETDELIEVDQQGNEIRRVSARSSSGGISLEAVSMLRNQRMNRTSYARPPSNGMVFYPAPVPRMLNLPKRLSQMPASDVRDRRRTQVLSQYGPEIRQSAPWLSESQTSLEGMHKDRSFSNSNSDEPPRAMLNERMSVANFNNLPPQLRASVFFEHQSVVQDVEIKSESAVATLDSILAASATAPVNAFTDHPFAGDVRKSVYGPDLSGTKRRSVADPLGGYDGMKMDNRRSVASLARLVRPSGSRIDLDDELQRRASHVPPLRMRKSHLSLGNELDMPTPEEAEDEDEGTSRPHSQGFARAPSRTDLLEDDELHDQHSPPRHRLTESEQIEADFAELEAAEDDVDDGEYGFVQPSTLLAELQVRKAQQKSRNRTAAVAYPNGMHSTLLQLDAVEEIRSRNRKAHRIALAWEDPNLQAADEEDGEDDVPLGMLYPGQKGRGNAGGENRSSRPLGLMEKRQLEDSEPLSSRRNRLMGLGPNTAPAASRSQLDVTAPDAGLAASDLEAEDEGVEGETLAERVRRLKRKSVLDAAISDVAPATGERPRSTFTDDVLSQFGDLDVQGTSAKGNPKSAEVPANEPEETLGQRRARLQKEAGGENRPALLRQRSSFANLLTANPAGMQSAKPKHEPHQGSLLDNNQQAQAKQREQLLMSNARSTSFGAPPVSYHDQGGTYAPVGAGLLGPQYSNGGRAPNGGFAGGRYNNGAGGIGDHYMSAAPQLRPSPSTPMLGAAMSMTTPLYFASPTAAYAAGGHMPNMMGHPIPQAGMNMVQAQVMPNAPYLGPGASAYGFPGGAPMGLQYGQTSNFYANPTATYAAAAMHMATPEAMMDRNQRANIDRWRMQIGQGTTS